MPKFTFAGHGKSRSKTPAIPRAPWPAAFAESPKLLAEISGSRQKLLEHISTQRQAQSLTNTNLSSALDELGLANKLKCARKPNIMAYPGLLAV